jgi:uncharacterized protein YcfJ
MKNILSNAAILLAIGLVGCSTNTQQQNTGVGAVTGAVVGGLAGSTIGGGTGQVVAIGAGAVIGALIGGAIGHSMDSTDNSNSYSIVKTNRMNQTTKWVNPRTGVVYTMTPTSEYFTINGNPNCRRFHFTATQHRKNHSFNGTVCYKDDGSWYTVR